MSSDFAARLRRREPMVGYWLVSDNPPATERLAAAGYDYLVIDLQHGLASTTGALTNLTALDAGAAAGGTATAGIVRVPANEDAAIYRALDAGATGILVPLVDTPAEAAKAANACRYPPTGTRSFGPSRSALRASHDPTEVNAAVACMVMIETMAGLRNVDAICAVPGVDAVYIGPSDLGFGVCGLPPAQAWATPEFAAAVKTIRSAAADAGIACGLHTTSGSAAAQALADGFTFASISNDLNHLAEVARRHLEAARGRGASG